MELKLDLTKEYGIVLEGGGAKGAYQIGAWKALREHGIRIKGVAGASVGALNGALICMDDLEKAEFLWENISYSQVMDISEDTAAYFLKGDLKSLNLKALITDGLRIIKDGGIDVTPLKNLMSETVDEEKIRNSSCEFYAVTYSISDRKRLNLNIKELPDGTIEDMLLASAYFLAFKNERLNGKKYMDGGGANNVPLDILVDGGYQDIIIIRIYGLGADREKEVEIPEGVHVHHIAPRKNLGGILEFDKKKCRRNITLGYYDAMRLLYGLEGRFYYIDAPESETYYLKRLLDELDMLQPFILEAGIEEKQAGYPEGYRRYMEVVFPEIAAFLKMKVGWNYKDLYLGILEEQARRRRIQRYKIYTVDELLEKLQKGKASLDSELSL